MYVDEVIRIGFSTDGGFLISYDRGIAPDVAKEEAKKTAKGNNMEPYVERWQTRHVPDVAAAITALKTILEKAVKPKSPEDEFSSAFKEAVKQKD